MQRRGALTAAAAGTAAGPAVSSRHGESRRFDIYVFATVVAKFSDNYGLLATARLPPSSPPLLQPLTRVR